MKNKRIFIYIVSLLLVFLVACNNNDNNSASDKEPKKTTQKEKNDFDYKNDNISSEFTNISSEKYPHTKPFVVQQAKYKYYVVGPGQNDNLEIPLQPGVDINDVVRGEMNKLQEGIKVPKQPNVGQAPNQQVPKQQATPAPKPQAKAPAPTPAPKETAPQAKAPAPQANAGISDVERKVIELTNNERRKKGLSELQIDTNLSKVAGVKSTEMQQKHYFSHTSPTYGSPFDMMRDFGVTYNAAGENIAHGQTTAEAVVQAWMNSEGHRKNILSPNFTHIGVGFESTGNYWSQMFIGK